MGCGASNTASVAAGASDSSIIDPEEKEKAEKVVQEKRMEGTGKSGATGAEQAKATKSVTIAREETDEGRSPRVKLIRKDTPHTLTGLAPPSIKTPSLEVHKEEAAGTRATATSPLKQKPESFKLMRNPLRVEGTESQIEFFRKLDMRIQQGPDYVEEEEEKKK